MCIFKDDRGERLYKKNLLLGANASKNSTFTLVGLTYLKDKIKSDRHCGQTCELDG